jgi:hypothetical protein
MPMGTSWEKSLDPAVEALAEQRIAHLGQQGCALAVVWSEMADYVGLSHSDDGDARTKAFPPGLDACPVERLVWLQGGKARSELDQAFLEIPRRLMVQETTDKRL